MRYYSKKGVVKILKVINIIETTSVYVDDAEGCYTWPDSSIFEVLSLITNDKTKFVTEIRKFIRKHASLFSVFDISVDASGQVIIYKGKVLRRR